MLNKFINTNYLDNTENLRKQFKNIKPFPHLVLKDFFNREFIKKFKVELKKEIFHRLDSDLYSFSQTDDLVNSKNSVIKDFYNFLTSKEFKDYLFKITNVKAEGKIDCSGFIYSSTDYLLPHDDRLESRRLAYVLNLSENFVKSDGGSLDLFDRNNIVKSIVPSFNTLTIFRVEINKTFHQVSEVLTNKERLSIAGWFND